MTVKERNNQGNGAYRLNRPFSVSTPSRWLHSRLGIYEVVRWRVAMCSDPGNRVVAVVGTGTRTWARTGRASEEGVMAVGRQRVPARTNY